MNKNKVEALLYLLLRDYVGVGDFVETLKDFNGSEEFFFSEDDDLIVFLRSKLKKKGFYDE